MMELEYKHTSRTNGAEVAVYLEGGLVGHIRHTKKGWQYFPRDHRVGGDVFPSLEECKKSLESE